MLHGKRCIFYSCTTILPMTDVANTSSMYTSSMRSILLPCILPPCGQYSDLINNPWPLKHIDTEKEKQRFQNKLNNRTIIEQIS